MEMRQKVTINDMIYESRIVFEISVYKTYNNLQRAININDFHGSQSLIKCLPIEAIIYIKQHNVRNYSTILEKLIMTDNKYLINYVLNIIKNIMDRTNFITFCSLVSKSCYSHRSLYSTMAYSPDHHDISMIQESAAILACNTSNFITMYFDLLLFPTIATAPVLPSSSCSSSSSSAASCSSSSSSAASSCSSSSSSAASSSCSSSKSCKEKEMEEGGMITATAPTFI
jgi:hypothetical protein